MCWEKKQSSRLTLRRKQEPEEHNDISQWYSSWCQWYSLYFFFQKKFLLDISFIYISNAIPQSPLYPPPHPRPAPKPTHSHFLALVFPCTGAYNLRTSLLFYPQEYSLCHPLPTSSAPASYTQPPAHCGGGSTWFSFEVYLQHNFFLTAPLAFYTSV
jgi:hypothetical protein